MRAGRSLLRTCRVAVLKSTCEFGHPQAVPVGDKDHGGVPVAVAVAFRRRDQSLDLILGQYSRVRRSPSRRRLGIIVRFTVVGDTTLRCGFAMFFALPD